MTTHLLSAATLNHERRPPRARDGLPRSSGSPRRDQAPPAAPVRISVVTATKNSVDTLAECLASVYQQSYVHREHIIIDGGSTDGTLAELEASRAHLDLLISEPDQGIYDALNKGLARASGDVIGFLNSDDLYADPHVLRRVAAAFADPDVEAVYGDLLYVKRRDPGQVIRYWRSCAYSPPLLRMGWMPPHPTLYLRREVFDRIGGFNQAYRIAADYDLMLRLLRQLQGRPLCQDRCRLLFEEWTTHDGGMKLGGHPAGGGEREGARRATGRSPPPAGRAAAAHTGTTHP